MTELLKRTVRNWCKQYFVKNRPKILVIEEIDAIATDIDEAKQAIIELEHRLEEITSHLREKVENEEQLTQAASYIYFTIPEVSTVWLTKGTDGRTNARYLWKFLRPINGCHCPACNSEIEISNRDFLYKALQGRLETSKAHLNIFAKYVKVNKTRFGPQHSRRPVQTSSDEYKHGLNTALAGVCMNCRYIAL